MSKRLSAVALIWLAVAIPSEGAVATTVVWEDQTATIDTHFKTLNSPRISPAGQVVFTAFLDGDGATSENDMTVWVKEASLIMMCREGYPYPAAGPGVTGLCPANGAMTSPISSSPPNIFGFQFLRDGSVTTADDTVLTYFQGNAAASVMVAREGDPAPGTDAFFQPGSSGHRVAPNGTVAFISGLLGGTDTTGIWAGPAGGVTCQVKAGDFAPGLGEPFQGFSLLQLSESGLIAFSGHTASGSSGLYRGSTIGTPTFMVGTGTAMPGGGTLSHVNSPSINRSGAVAFRGTLQSGQSGIYVATPVDVQAVAFPGMAAPDYGTFNDCGFPSMSGNGNICFWADMSVGEDGIYCEIDGNLQVIVREDDSPPALNPGETVGDLYWYPVVNPSGQVLFISQVSTGGGAELTWWLRRTTGQLEPIVRFGQPLEIAPGISKTVNDLFLPTGDFPYSTGSGNATVLNGRGEITFWAEFTDGSKGIFLSRPEAADPGILFRNGFESGTLGAWTVP